MCACNPGAVGMFPCLPGISSCPSFIQWQIGLVPADGAVTLLCSPEELPEGCSTNRLKDDGILDCLRHFKEAGYHIFLCTRDKQFACRSQVTFWLSLHLDAFGSTHQALPH